MKTDEFKQWVPILQPAMQRMAEHLLGSPQEAEDMVQDLFVELWQQRKHLSQVDNLQGYCIRMTQFKCIDLLRSRRIVMQPLDSCPQPPDAQPSDSDPIDDQLFQQLQQRIALLPPAQQELLKLRYWQGLSSSQIGQHMHISQGNVRVRLNRIIANLRDQLVSPKSFRMNNKLKILITLLGLTFTSAAFGQLQPRQFQHSSDLFADTARNSFKLAISHGNEGGFTFATQLKYTFEYDRKINRYIDLGAFASYWQWTAADYSQSTLSTPHVLSFVNHPLFALGASLNIHPLAARWPAHNRFDLYFNLRAGSVFNPNRQFDYIESNQIVHLQTQMFYFCGEFNLGLSYALSSHWTLFGEFGWRQYCARQVFTPDHYTWSSIPQAQLGINFQF